jgi:hypothetical protein
MNQKLSAGAAVFVPRPEAAGVADAMIEAITSAARLDYIADLG